MKDVKSVIKGSEVSITSNSSYKAVSHDDVTAILHDPITNAGIIALPDMVEHSLEILTQEKTYNGVTNTSKVYMVKVIASVTFINIDNPEDRLTTKCFAYALDSGDKATGKAYSMAVKYCYLKTFMLESLDDEESREIEKAPAPQYNKTPAPKKEPIPEVVFKAPPKPATPSFKIDDDKPTAKTDKTLQALATAAQKNALKKMNIAHDENITMDEASKLIGDAYKNKGSK